MIGDQSITPEQEAELRRGLGLDRPLVERFLVFLGNAVQFDFGESFYHRRPVGEVIAERLPASIEVGTVDKFQGREAPVVLYSMATSSPELAPRGMEFLYSLNRLNVATSRAQCAAIVIASPRLFEPDCRSPRQMQLANALCRLREMATTISI